VGDQVYAADALPDHVSMGRPREKGPAGSARAFVAYDAPTDRRGFELSLAPGRPTATRRPSAFIAGELHEG
jgi:hypothetical protein